MEETIEQVTSNVIDQPEGNANPAQVDTAQVDTAQVDTAQVEPAQVSTDAEVTNQPKSETLISKAVQKSETVDQVNFRALRLAKRKAEEERDELYERIARSDREKNSRALESEHNSDTRVMANETESQRNRREIREIRDGLKRDKDTVETRNIENKLRETYPDLESVISEDNIEVLKARDANFAKLVSKGPSSPSDLYHRAIAAYSLIKKYGIHVDDNHSVDRARVEANMSKPRPATAASTTSEGLSDFAGFVNMNTEERRNAIFAMARKRANG